MNDLASQPIFYVLIPCAIVSKSPSPRFSFFLIVFSFHYVYGLPIYFFVYATLVLTSTSPVLNCNTSTSNIILMKYEITKLFSWGTFFRGHIVVFKLVPLKIYLSISTSQQSKKFNNGLNRIQLCKGYMPNILSMCAYNYFAGGCT